jgi:hypothetical protein
VTGTAQKQSTIASPTVNQAIEPPTTPVSPVGSIPEPEPELAAPSTPQPPPVPFAKAQDRADFENAILVGDLTKYSSSGVDVTDQAAAIEAWVSAVSEAQSLDVVIAHLEAASSNENAPPQVAFALAALYGRKGLIQKQYAALEKAESAAKARPDVVFALTAVYGRKETLKTKYGADELLVGSLRVESEPSGAKLLVDGKELGLTPLMADKLKDGQHKLRLESEGYDPWEVPFDIDTGRETKIAAKLGAKPGSIEVILTPALGVKLDNDNYIDSPHLFEGITPGDHILNFRTLVDRRYYTVKKGTVVNVLPGKKSVIQENFQVARTFLKLSDLPTGGALYIDGIPRSTDDAKAASESKGLEIDAGIYDVKIVLPNGQKWYYNASSVMPKHSNSFRRAEMVAVLARRTIKLDGKTDSWDGLEPMFEVNDTSFMADKAYGIKRAFLCRDDKYLYWRVDFNEQDPLQKPPKGTGKYIQSGLYAPVPGGNVDLSVSSAKDNNVIRTWCGIYHSGGKFTSMGGDHPISVKYGDSMYVAQFKLSQMSKYFKSTMYFNVGLGNVENSTWVQSYNSPSFAVDFDQ